MLVSAAALLALLGGASAAPEPLSVLFVGNSYTFVNDVPALVGNLSAAAGLPIRHAQATPGGASLFQHANTSLAAGRATLELLRSEIALDSQQGRMEILAQKGASC